MAHQAPNSSGSGRSVRGHSSARSRTPGALNTLKPSRALVSWIDRAVSNLTTETPWTYGDEAPLAARASAERRAVNSPRSAAQQMAVPDDVRTRFVQVGRDYYFQSGTRAFRDQGQKLISRTENEEVIRSLVQIAKARGWSDITVTGTQRFKRDAWRFATVSGLVLRGYRPTDFEKQKLVRAIAVAREPRRPINPIVDTPVGEQSGDAGSKRRTPKGGESPQSAEDAGDREGARRVSSAKRERQYSGALLEHGSAPYDFHPQGEPSYFVRIRTERGPRLLWGKDLERAIRDANAQPGDEVHVRQTGRESVTVKRKERDESGRVLDERNVQAHRNQWQIRRERDDANHPSADAGRQLHGSDLDGRTAARERPEVQGARLALKGARLFAEQRIKDPEQRTAFVNAVRAELVKVLNTGAAVPNPRLREGQEAPYSPARTLS